ncbi:MAG: glycoside hydrolase family 32 protein [Bullifex sp.]
MRFTIENSKKYLVLPYLKGAEEREVRFYDVKEKLLTSLLLEFREEGNREVFLPSSLFSAQLVIDGPEGLEDLVRTSDDIPYEKPHFQYHYTPAFGWINDPNGMHFRDGIYHLYYQYNPVSEKWNNMSWGHAVSRDMVTFSEEVPVFLPKDDSHVIFSGSALDGEFAYTVANIKGERAFYQERRYSDDGYTFTEPEVIIPNSVSDERDPRLFRYNGRKYLLLWLKGNTFALYRDEYDSYGMVNTFDAEGAWECPDLLKADGKLFFTSADGFYFEAEIDEEGLHLISERKEMFLTKLPYASQSFTGTDDTYMISWLRVATPHLPTTGAMSMVRKVGYSDGVLTLKPTDELLSRFALNRETEGGYSSSEEVLYLIAEGSFEGTLFAKRFCWDSESGILSYGDEDVHMNTSDRTLHIFIDHEITEISSGDWKSLASFENTPEKEYDETIRLRLNDTVLKEFIWR